MVAIGAIAIFVVIFEHTALGRARARYIANKYGLVTDNSELSSGGVLKNIKTARAEVDSDADLPEPRVPESTAQS